MWEHGAHHLLRCDSLSADETTPSREPEAASRALTLSQSGHSRRRIRTRLQDCCIAFRIKQADRTSWSDNRCSNIFQLSHARGVGKE